MQKALNKVGYQQLRKEQEEKRKKGELMGIGISSFTEIVGAGPSHTFDIVALTRAASESGYYGAAIQHWIFALFFIGLYKHELPLQPPS